MRAVLLHKGRFRKVFALGLGNDMPIYRNDLDDKIDEKTRYRIVSHIEFLSNTKFPVTNIKISKKLKGYTNLYELRPLPARLFFFMMGNDVIITSGIIKKKNSTDISDIEKAEALRKRFIKGD